MEREEEEDTTPIADRKRKEALVRKRRGGVEFSSEEVTKPRRVKVEDEAVQVDQLLLSSEQVQSHGSTSQGESLLSIVKRMRKEEESDPDAARIRKQREEEERVLESTLGASTQALVSAEEKARDVKFRERIVRKWSATVIPEPDSVTQAIIDSKLILVDGLNVPPPISKFENMHLPQRVLQWLVNEKNITTPTPIQMQGMPVALSGRDMIGVASTGSGKTLCFLIPSIVCCLEEDEIHGRLRANEGPYVLVLGPSRELQRQTFQIAEEICGQALNRRLSVTLAIGGENKSVQLSIHRSRGSHIVIGTPGRVVDFLSSKELSLSKCTLLVLDEGDRMMDEGFDEEIKKVIGFFHQRRRQTLLFSATMPRRVVEFARDALVDAIVVNVGRAGAASSNIIQYVEPVEKAERFVKVLDALERTAPPVLMFCTKNGDVDDLHEYLMLKGLEVRGIHAGKSQQDRNQAVDDFKAGIADILVASDVAAKGLDFPKIEHVINFDMPSEIEQYVHRIGRTGRGGHQGMATTFIDLSHTNSTLLKDLFGVLKEARQRAPLFLIGGDMGEYVEPSQEPDSSESITCSVCGGFGHRVTNCPKLAQISKKSMTRDVVTGGDY